MLKGKSKTTMEGAVGNRNKTSLSNGGYKHTIAVNEFC